MKLSYGRLWEDMVAMFRGHSELLLAIAGVFLFLPSLLSKLVIPVPQITSEGLAAVEQYLAHYRAHWPMIFMLSLPTSLGQAAILALLLDPSRPTVAIALKRGLTLLISFILLNMIVNFSIALGIALFIIPGLYLIGRTFVAGSALIAEHATNPIHAFKRGFDLSRGNGWRIFGMLAIIIVVAIIMSSAATSVAGVVFALIASTETASVGTALVASILDMLVALVLTLFAASLYRELAAPPR